MPHRPEKREGPVIGGMLRLFQKWVPRLRAGLDWITHFLLSRVTLIDGAVSSLKRFFSLPLYLDFHLVPHVTGPGGSPPWGLAWSQPHGPRACSGFVSPGLGRAHCFGYGRPEHPVGRWSLRGTLGHRASQAAFPVHFLGFQTSGFFSLLFSPWFHISRGRHGNCPVGSGPVPGPEVLGRLRETPRWRWQGGLEVRKLPGASQRPLRAWIDAIPMGPVPLFQDLPRTIRKKLQRSQKGPRSTV